MKKTNVAFFIGTDITSHIIVAKFLEQTKYHENLNVWLYYVDQKLKKSNVEELNYLGYYERTFVAEKLYPFIEKFSSDENDRGFFAPPHILANRYICCVSQNTITDVNSQSIYDELKNNAIDYGFSVRCYQKFGERIIDLFSDKDTGKTTLYNLHPGILPNYRGVTTFARSMQNKEVFAGYTMHEINKDWDSGRILAIAKYGLDYSLSVVENMVQGHKLGSDLITYALENTNVIAISQDEKQAKYYTHATKEEMQDYNNKDICLINPTKLYGHILSKFTDIDNSHVNTFLNDI